MFRDFRWQLVALVVSIMIFGMTFAFRVSERDQRQPTPTPTTGLSAAATTSPTHTAPPPIIAAEATPDIVGDPEIIGGVQTFREALVGDITRLNPLLALPNAPEADITSLIFEGLTRINEFGEAEGALAESWVVSRDGLEYVFQLRQDILWQDGTPFSAADVVYTLSLLSSRDFPGLPEVGAFWRTVEIEQLDPHLVRFRLAQPLSTFPVNLTIGILPEHALRGTTAAMLPAHPFNLTPVGTGPYQLEALRSNDNLRIEAVDLRVAPVYQQRSEAQDIPFAMERVRFQLYPTFEAALQALEEGAADGLAARSMSERPALLRVGGVNIHTAIEPTLGVLIYNWDEERRFFSEQRVRNALQVGLNRENPVISQLNNRAVVADSPLLFTSWAYAGGLTWPATNPTEAMTLFTQANIFAEETPSEDAEATESPAPPTESPLTFGILTRDDPSISAIAQQIAAQWGQYGLTVTVESVPQQAYEARLEMGDFDAAIVELALGADPDVYAYWHVGQYPDGLNYGGVADDRLSELLERARRETNGINRVDLYRTFQRTFIERGIAIPLYHPLFTYAVRQTIDDVQLGFISAPSDRLRTIGTWE